MGFAHLDNVVIQEGTVRFPDATRFVPILRLVCCSIFQGPGLMKHPGVSPNQTARRFGFVVLNDNVVSASKLAEAEGGKRRLL